MTGVIQRKELLGATLNLGGQVGGQWMITAIRDLASDRGEQGK